MDATGTWDACDAMAVVPPHNTASGMVEVLVAAQGSIWTVDADHVQDQNVAQGLMQKMAVAPNGQLLACFTHDGDELPAPHNPSLFPSHLVCPLVNPNAWSEVGVLNHARGRDAFGISHAAHRRIHH
jgi:hypothetical protein